MNGTRERRDDGPDARPGVEEAGRQGALRAGEPLGHRFHGGGEVARLAQPQGGAGDAEPEGGAREGVTDGGEAPEGQRGGVAQPRPDAINQAARRHQADGVGRLEGHDDVAVVHFAPPQPLRQLRLQDADDLPVQIVDGRGEEEQRADPPPVAAEGVGRGGSGRRGFVCLIEQPCGIISLRARFVHA